WQAFTRSAYSSGVVDAIGSSSRVATVSGVPVDAATSLLHRSAAAVFVCPPKPTSIDLILGASRSALLTTGFTRRRVRQSGRRSSQHVVVGLQLERELLVLVDRPG